jgi:glycerophosphoryl diester phosphodiesterase
MLIILPRCTKDAPAWTNAAAGLVAHAGGNVDGVQGTNAIEAVEYNYNMGHRVFELDFNLTSDDVLAGIHDWGEKNIAPAWAEFSAKKILDRYTPTSYEQFIRFLSTHKDAYIVTDTKSYDLTDAQIAKQFQIMYDTTEKVDPSIRERIIIQVYNQNMYHLINKIYKYPNILYTLYATPDTEDQAAKFIESEHIPVVVMPPERANQPFLDRLTGLGARIYLHTLNDYNEVESWRSKGVWGVYTDSLLPKDFAR